MDEELLIKTRGEVIKRSINIETIIGALITQHYFGKINLNFFTEVLYDEFFGFGLKINILSKVLGQEAKTNIDKLRRIGTIRNRFAHSDLNIGGKYPDPKDLSKEIDFKKLSEEFKPLASELEIYLAEKCKEKGIEFLKE